MLAAIMQKRVSWKSFSCYVPVLYLYRRDGISKYFARERTGEKDEPCCFPKNQSPQVASIAIGLRNGFGG